MVSSQIQEIEQLTQKLARRQPVADESKKVIQAVINSPDPAALPALRQALRVAVQYRQWAQALSESTPSDFKKKAAGGWVVDLLPHYGNQIVSCLRSAIERCTPEGQPVVYEP